MQGGLLKKSDKIKSLSRYQDNFFNYCKENSIDPVTASISFVNNLKKFKYINIGIDNLKQFKMIISSKKKIKNLNFEKLKVDNFKIIDPRKWK